MIQLRRILSASMAAALVLTALVVPASAHGGHHGRGRNTSVYCSYCEEYHTRGTHCDGCDYTAHTGCGGGHGHH